MATAISRIVSRSRTVNDISETTVESGIINIVAVAMS